MALRVETFSNRYGGNTFFKAVAHPLAARAMQALLAQLGERRLCVYDPFGYAATLDALYGLSRRPLTGVYVQDVSAVGAPVLGHAARPVTELAGDDAQVVLVAAFDAERVVAQARHLLPTGAQVVSLDRLRLPAAMLSRPERYLDPLNFATNFAFFRDAGGRHTRLVTANYWSGYGAVDVRLWCCLFDEAGTVLAEWDESLEADAGVVIDSRDLRRRFGLPAFTGQLFVHAQGVAGHDVVKYALDLYGDSPEELSCTHDANAWPADYYAGLPAPNPGERVVLWVQNSHPVAIPAGAVGLAPMGRDTPTAIEQAVPPFATLAVDVGALLPGMQWPAQVEIHAGKHFVRPRYEVESAGGRRRIAHVNVERTDLEPDPQIPGLGKLLGRGYLLPAPLLPVERYRCLVLPTPMARSQASLPTALAVFDRRGREVAATRLGNLPRHHATAIDVTALLAERGALPEDGWGHMELLYDFAEGGQADGWLHALFRYEDRHTGHAADTSFGAHIFNSLLTYRDEPQSYAGRPPGLSTRLFLRLGEPACETFCQLVYPASTPWHDHSDTLLSLCDRGGRELARHRLAIACGGSCRFHVSALFAPGAIAASAGGGYLLVRDTSCRLFGYHGLDNRAAFSLDHMFGF